ncbi:hypothetical protein CPB84DRAFT_254255 [Gymnopilus junonius]|uniref:Uncharacterized protein n=1 Tax=Gymnopilus junonius TaxID=109634 RepID=A0A9P5TJ33_GYMJU|nr:hypothetical protein CPB84DRAFT_254255 [Gymnopilus junonius]
MSNAEQNPQLSTPQRPRGTASLSQAGNDKLKQEELKQDLELDLQNSVKCDFDRLLKYFLSLVMDPDTEEKKELDDLQARIEKMQSDRYYTTTKPKQSNTAGTSTQPNETARREESTDDIGLPDEQKLVAEREEILQKLLERALDNAVTIANDLDVRKPLIKLINCYGESTKENVILRMSPYAIRPLAIYRGSITKSLECGPQTSWTFAFKSMTLAISFPSTKESKLKELNVARMSAYHPKLLSPQSTDVKMSTSEAKYQRLRGCDGARSFHATNLRSIRKMILKDSTVYSTKSSNTRRNLQRNWALIGWKVWILRRKGGGWERAANQGAP